MAATTQNYPWSIDPGAVREAALLVAGDADLLDFACAAITLGVPSAEAGRIAEILAERKKQARGGR